MNKDLMIQACFWSNMFYSMSYPFIHLFIMKDDAITGRLVSIQQVVMCLSIILINNLWNKYSLQFYKWFKVFLFLESITYLILMLGMSLDIFSPFIYYVADMILFSLITKNIICGSNKLRALRYKDEAREKYDNTIPIAAAFATLIGSFIAIVINIPIPIAFMLSWIGIVIDNIFYWIVYDKYKIENELE